MRFSLPGSLFAAALATAAVTAAITCQQRPSSGAPAPAAAAAALAPLRHVWGSPETRVYDLSIDLRATVDPEAPRRVLLPSGGAQSQAKLAGQRPATIERHFALTGTLEVTVVALEGARVTTHVRLVDVRAGALPAGTDVAALHAALADGVVAMRTLDGRVDEVRLPAGADPTAVAVLDELLALTQVSLADDARAPSWTADEASTQGRWRTRYVRQVDDRLVKTVTAFAPLEPSLGGGRTLPVQGTVDGSLTLQVDAATGALAGAHGFLAEIVTVPGLDATPFVHTIARVDLEQRARRAASAIELARYQVRGALDAPVMAPVRSEAEVRADREALVGAASYEELVAALAGEDDREVSIGRLGAYLGLHPDAIATTAARLAKPTSGPIASGLVGALLNEGSDAAQVALARTAHRLRLREPEDCVGIVVSLGSLVAPAPATVEHMLALAHRSDAPRCAGVAELTLGRMARRLSANAPARARALIDGLLADLEASHDDARRGHLLRALGNTGAQAILPTLARYLSAEQPPLRAAAAQALRLLTGPEVETHLADRLTRETDARVLVDVMTGLANRPLTQAVAVALARQVRAPYPRALRLEMIDVLARARSLDVAVDEVLAALRSDSDEKVAARARAALQG